MSGIELETRQMLFVLGVERSGSTWLANLVDSSPDVLSYMEPFTEVTDLFRGFPDRLTHMSEAGSFLRDEIVETLEGLPRYKYFGLEGAGSPGWLRRLNWRSQRALHRMYDLLGAGWNRSRLRYGELNFNRAGNPEVFEFDKSERPDCVAIKELRLNFKAGVLAEVFPEARTMVILRNPLAQIDSILRRIAEDSLVYLRRFLGVFFESIAGQERFREFREPIDGLPDDELVARAVAYWFVNYTTLLEDLRASGLEHRVVLHEDLCEDPMAETTGVFEFADLELTPQTRTYVRQSSQTPGGTGGPTATRRDSSAYYRRALNDVDGVLRERFWEYAEGFWELTPAPVRDYRDWLRDALSAT